MLTRFITQNELNLLQQECAAYVTDEDLALGRVYPSLDNIRDVSLKIAVATCTYFYDNGLAGYVGVHENRYCIVI